MREKCGQNADTAGKTKIPNSYELAIWDFFMVPGAGVEPARHCCHWCLRPTRLPIPPSGLHVPESAAASVNLSVKTCQVNAFRKRASPSQEASSLPSGHARATGRAKMRRRSVRIGMTKIGLFGQNPKSGGYFSKNSRIFFALAGPTSADSSSMFAVRTFSTVRKCCSSVRTVFSPTPSICSSSL